MTLEWCCRAWQGPPPHSCKPRVLPLILGHNPTHLPTSPNAGGPFPSAAVEQLRVHVRRHKGVRKFECTECGYKFTRQVGLEPESLPLAPFGAPEPPYPSAPLHPALSPPHP